MSGRRAHLAGLAAEEAALRLYQPEGARLLAARWRCPEGEIDLILQLGETVIFVEVKARRDGATAAAAVSTAQWRRIGRAAERYLAENAGAMQTCRFDLVTIDGDGRAERIENAAAFDGW